MSGKSKHPADPAVEPDDAVQAFIDNLVRAPSGHHVIRGMVKPADTADGVMFSHPGLCDHWLHIPKSAIQSIRGAGRVACKGHFHAGAEIQLKAPETDLERTFAGLVSLNLASAGQPCGPAPPPPKEGCPEGTTWKHNEWCVWDCW